MHIRIGFKKVVVILISKRKKENHSGRACLLRYHIWTKKYSALETQGPKKVLKTGGRLLKTLIA